MTTTETTSTIRLSVAALDALLRDVRQGASRGDTLPMLCGVLLHTAETNGRTVLVATSTNRYVAIQGRATAEGSVPRLWLTWQQIKQVRAQLGPLTRRRYAYNARASITVDGERVTIRATADDSTAAKADRLAAVELAVDLDANPDFPDVPKLIRAALDDAPAAEPATVNPHLLHRTIGKAAARRGYTAALRMWSTGERKPVIAQADADLVAMIMPTKQDVGGEPVIHPLPATAKADR